MHSLITFLFFHWAFLKLFKSDLLQGSVRTQYPNIYKCTRELSAFRIIGFDKQFCRAAMTKPRPGGTVLVISLTSEPGKYDLNFVYKFSNVKCINKIYSYIILSFSKRQHERNGLKIYMFRNILFCGSHPFFNFFLLLEYSLSILMVGSLV